MRRVIRQGDVILRELEEEGGSRTGFHEADRIEIGGETGNTHVIRPISGKVLFNDETGVVVVTEKAEIVHPEHRRIVIPRGRWLLTRVRQWTGARGSRSYAAD